MADARLETFDEPATPRRLVWRLLIYPVALGVGALAAAYESGLLFLLFAVLMLTPIWIKWRSWGGVRRAIEFLFRSRGLVITRDGKVFAALVILFGVAAINTGTNLLYLILAMMITFMVLSTLLANLNLRGLRISRRLPAYVFAGEEFRVRLIVANPRKRTPALALEARERAGPFGADGRRSEGPPLFFFAIDPGDRKAGAIHVRLARRGVYPLEGFSISTRFPFGFTIQTVQADLPGEIVVFPTPRELSGDAIRALGAAQDVPRPRAIVHAPEEFRSLREYRPRDNPRWIHWRSSARVGKLLVKEFEPRATRRAALIIDSAVPAGLGAVETLDRGLTLAVSILERLYRQGERPEIALQVKDEVVRFTGEAGPREIAALLETLARLEPAADPEYRRLIEAAGPAVRRGARLFLITAREPAMVRAALERAEPGTAAGLEVFPFAREEEVRRYYAPPGKKGARGGGRRLVGSAPGGDGNGGDEP